jgi:hypothetical protein
MSSSRCIHACRSCVTARHSDDSDDDAPGEGEGEGEGDGDGDGGGLSPLLFPSLAPSACACCSSGGEEA